MAEKKTPTFWEKKLDRITKENRALKKRIDSENKSRKELSSALKKKERLFDALPFGMLVIQQGRIEDVNQKILDQLGCHTGSLLG